MLKVFYRPEQSCAEANGFSPSAGKPALVMKDWLSNPDIAIQIQVSSFEPVSREILYGAHNKEYVDNVLDGKVENGFGNRSKAIANSLLYTSGSLLEAAKYVIEKSSPQNALIAVSPTSGFHHAEYDQGGGFCTFNGLMATAIELHRLGLAKKILILDFDHHYGNGTQDIIKRLRIDFVTHITAEKSYKSARECLDVSDILGNHTICSTCHDRKYDLIIYQAGADIHINDPLGGLLTTSEMAERDSNIFWGSQGRKTPLVWNLAGGYQRDPKGSIEPVLSLHRQTMLQCLQHVGVQ